MKRWSPAPDAEKGVKRRHNVPGDAYVGHRGRATRVNDRENDLADTPPASPTCSAGYPPNQPDTNSHHRSRLVLRTTLTALVLSAVFAATSHAARVAPPDAGTPDSDIPGHYTRARIVGSPRMTSSATGDGRGGQLRLTAWTWQDRKGRSYRLTRRLHLMKDGPVGSLGAFDLKVTVAKKVAPKLPAGNMKPAPDGMSDQRIPYFYTQAGVKDLTMSSSVGTDRDGNRITETSWRWNDRDGVTYHLTRKKIGSQASFNLKMVR